MVRARAKARGFARVHVRVLVDGGEAQGDTRVRDAAWPWRAAGGIPHECEATEGEEERRGVLEVRGLTRDA